MEELHSMMVSQSAQIAVLTAGRDEAVEESTRFKILLDKFESQSGVMNTAEYQFHLTRAESLFPALELLGDDKILISRMNPLKDLYSRAVVIHEALAKTEPDVEVARKYSGQITRLLENTVEALHGSLLLPKGPIRYNYIDAYSSLTRGRALGVQDGNWGPAELVIEPDSRTSKRARELVEAAAKREPPAVRVQTTGKQPPQNNNFNGSRGGGGFSGGGRPQQQGNWFPPGQQNWKGGNGRGGGGGGHNKDYRDRSPKRESS
jgi:hypothetical protein